MQRLLVSIRGPKEAIEATRGGAQIADVEYPASALGTPYPLNILATRNRLNRLGFRRVLVSTNIGEVQSIRASSCQAALGVAIAGADLIKFGLAEQSLDSAIYLAQNIVKTVHKLSPKRKRLFPAIFIDEDMQRFLRVFTDGPKLARESGADGILIDTFNKLIGKSLLDYCTLKEIANFVKAMHEINKEAWIAGSITIEDMPGLWKTGVNVICVRGAACSKEKGGGRFGEVKEDVVRKLISTRL
ncbi:MAG TPA: (5-formylfuran-3-yl)methyl phosphate synthase [Elusimicrobiota bacterium]|nr:(5-formylfuran-3-yl)methyl phosphate synthase [Elusimicrobiota bacterium]